MKKNIFLLIICFITISPHEKIIISKFLTINKSLKKSLENAWINITNNNKSIIIKKNKNIICLKGSKRGIFEFEEFFKSIDVEKKCVSISIQSGSAQIIDSFNFGIDEFGIYNKNKKNKNSNFNFVGIGGQLGDFPTPTLALRRYANLLVNPSISNINLNQEFIDAIKLQNENISRFINGAIFTSPSYLNIPLTFGGPNLNLARLSPTLNTLINKENNNTVINSNFIIKDRETLNLLSGENLPIYSQNTVPVNNSFKLASGIKYIDLGIKLSIIPIIDKNLNGITLHIYLEILILTRGSTDLFFSILRIVSNPPVLDKRRIEQTIYIKDNESILISGLTQTTKNKELRNVPFFSKIPLLGKLFQSTLDKSEKLDQFILITPKIIK